MQIKMEDIEKLKEKIAKEKAKKAYIDEKQQLTKEYNRLRYRKTYNLLAGLASFISWIFKGIDKAEARRIKQEREAKILESYNKRRSKE